MSDLMPHDFLENTLPDISKKMIIGLCGKKKVGKSTTARFLKKRFSLINVPSTILSFGDTLKKEAAGVYQCDLDLFYKTETKETYIHTFVMEDGDPRIPQTAIRLDNNKYKDLLRHLLQWYGTEYRRKENPHYWVNATKNEILYQCSKYDIIILDDIRFPNEANCVKSFPNHMLIKIFPYEQYQTTDASQHASETALDKYYIEYEAHPKYGKFFLQLLSNNIFKSDDVNKFIKSLPSLKKK